MTHFQTHFRPKNYSFFFITQSEKHTSAKFVRFKSLYKVYILGFPSSSGLGSPMGPLGFWTLSLFIDIFTEEKCRMRHSETTTCLCFHSNLSLSLFQHDWQFSICPFVCVHRSNICQSTAQRLNLFIYVWFVAGKDTVEKESVISRLIIPTTGTRRQIISWIWPQLIAAVEDLDSLLPPGFHLFSHQAQNAG